MCLLLCSLVLLLSLGAGSAGAATPTFAESDDGAHFAQACAPPAPGHLSCFALVRERAASRQTQARPGVQPLVAGPTAAPAGPAGGLTPGDLASAYGFTPALGGAGQTVGIVDAYDDPSIEADLGAFDANYALPSCTVANGCLRKVGQAGGAVPTADTTGWSVEVALDVETVHAACPNCKILLVESNDNSSANLAAATNEAVALGATVVSNSYGGPESTTGAAERAAYDHRGVPVVAATGDDGYYSWDYINSGFFGYEMPVSPASLPTVVAVGATRLALNSDGSRAQETVWDWSGPGDEFEERGATGGGCSRRFEAQPWQRLASGFADSGCGAGRLDADVSVVGDPETGLDVYDTFACGSACEKLDKGWETIGGTSLSAPLVSALYALAGGGHGVAYPAVTLYGQRADATARYDVTEGGNGFCGGESVAQCGHANSFGAGLIDCEGTTACNAVPGLDGPSGVGTPNGLGLFEDQPPSASLSLPGSLTANSAATFSAAITGDAYPGGSIAGASWDWGDGSPSGSGISASHSYGAPGTYTVTMVATDGYGVRSEPVTRAVVVGAAASGGATGPSAGAVSLAPPAAGTTGSGQPSGGAAGFQTAATSFSPQARLASVSLHATGTGAVTLKIACAAARGSCSGTVTLRTTGPLSAAGAGKATRKAITLASASFSVLAGRTAAVTLHMSARARELLSRTHLLHAIATILLRASGGSARSSTAAVTLRAVAVRHGSH